MPTQEQENDFRGDMFYYINHKTEDTILNAAIQWMQQNLEPEDIFSEKQLSNWAEAAGWVKP